MAAKATITGHVEWFVADGKYSFLKPLKANIRHYGGIENSLTVFHTLGLETFRESIQKLPDRISDDCSMLVIDPVTRALDMSRKNPVMWGRELLEDVMPVLTGLAISRGTDIVITSEVRNLDDEVTPIHHQTIKKWVDHDILLTRKYGSRGSLISYTMGGEPREIGKMVLRDDGVVEVHRIDGLDVREGGNNECSVSGPSN